MPNEITDALKDGLTDVISRFEKLAGKRWDSMYVIVPSVINVEGWSHASTQVTIRFDDALKHIHMDFYLDQDHEFVFEATITNEELWDGTMQENAQIKEKFTEFDPGWVANLIIDKIIF